MDNLKVGVVQLPQLGKIELPLTLLAQCRQRPVLYPPREHQSAQEVGKVVGQREELQPHRVVGEAAGMRAVSTSARTDPP